MSTVPLPMKRFVELPPEVVPRLGPALALTDAAGEADAVGDPAKFAPPNSVLAAGVASSARDDPPQPATTATIAADTALAIAKRHRRCSEIRRNQTRGRTLCAALVEDSFKQVPFVAQQSGIDEQAHHSVPR